MRKSNRPNPLTPYLAGMLAWIIPGAGHVYLGRTVRGIIICVCVNGMFWAGMAMGGVFTVDPLGERWWFIGQISTGVSGAAAWYHQQDRRKALADEFSLGGPRPGRSNKAEYDKALHDRKLALVYPTDIVSRAYTGVAGMLNLMCIFDAILLALMGQFGEPPPEVKKPPGGKAKEAAE